MTPIKILTDLAIQVIKEIEKSPKNITIEYSNNGFNVTFFDNKGNVKEYFLLHKNNDVLENKETVRDLILKIRGIRR